MKQIFDNLLALGTRRLAILGATAAVIMGLLIFGLSTVLSPSYRPVATDLSASDAAAMVSALEQAGYQPRISSDGTLVSLPEGDLARARMTLAEAGVAAQGLPGWEIFDNQSGIGMNTFLQRVNRLRALEGELSRSIQTIDVVESARVHLVLPEREAFSAERPEPSAAVIIRTKRGMILERKQALAVRSLVAAALPGLSPERVTVLSASGETILSAEDENGSTSGGIQATRVAMEERIARNIEQMLSARVGAGNVRVRVAAELATAREVILKESFDPDGRVARETRSLTDNSQSRQGSGDSTDVATNIPGGLNGEESGDSRADNRERSEDESRFEIGSTRSETVIEPGGLRRLSVAVLVNGTMVDNEYQDRSPEELERLALLVRSTMGFDETRGDLVTVDSLRFVDGGGLSPAAEEANISESLLGHIPGIIRWLVALLIVLIVVFFAIRPALARLNKRDEEAVKAVESNEETTEEDGIDGEVLDENGEPKPNAGANGLKAKPRRLQANAEDDDSDFEEDEYVALASVKGNVTKRHLKELGELVERENDASLRQIRLWLNQK